MVMNLPGSLKLTTLGDVLGALHREHADGVLELVEAHGASAGRRHKVYFSGGLVDGAETELAHPRLGEILVEQGVLQRDALSALLRRLVEAPDRRVGEILLAELNGGEATVSRALRSQLRAKLDAIFRLGDALLRFSVRRKPQERGVRAEPLSPSEFLHGRPRSRRHATIGGEGRATRREESEKAHARRLLGLSDCDGASEARRAFRRLAAAHHPDRFPNASAEEMARLLRRFSAISQAYHKLSS
jgi:hypothetical protein